MKFSFYTYVKVREGVTENWVRTILDPAFAVLYVSSEEIKIFGEYIVYVLNWFSSVVHFLFKISVINKAVLLLRDIKRDKEMKI